MPWPPWLDMISVISHLALTISCSLSFYIYYGKYGLRRKLARMRFLMKPLRRQQLVMENMEDLILPDMSNLVDKQKETTIQTEITGEKNLDHAVRTR